jgi:hypothetical protein
MKKSRGVNSIEKRPIGDPFLAMKFVLVFAIVFLGGGILDRRCGRACGELLKEKVSCGWFLLVRFCFQSVSERGPDSGSIWVGPVAQQRPIMFLMFGQAVKFG